MAHIVQADPATGLLELADGTVYDFSRGTVEVAEEHIDEVTFAAAKRLEETGKLTEIVHGPGWTGTPATVEGTAGAFRVIPGQEA